MCDRSNLAKRDADPLLDLLVDESDCADLPAHVQRFLHRIIKTEKPGTDRDMRKAWEETRLESLSK
jgi:hypothetical protein